MDTLRPQITRREMLKRFRATGVVVAAATAGSLIVPGSADAARPPEPEGQDPLKNLLSDVRKFNEENPLIAKQFEDFRQSYTDFVATEMKIAEDNGHPIGGIEDPIVDSAISLWAIRQPEVRKFMRQVITAPEADIFHNDIDNIANLLQNEPQIELVPYYQEKALNAAKGGEPYKWSTELEAKNPLLAFIRKCARNTFNPPAHGRDSELPMFNDKVTTWVSGILYYDVFPKDKVEFNSRYNAGFTRRGPVKDANGQTNWGWFIMDKLTEGLGNSTIPMVESYLNKSTAPPVQNQTP